MTKVRKRKVHPLAIERSEVVSQARIRSPDLVRLTRVKYEGNDFTFVDIRMFSRGYDDDGNEVFHPTGKGIQVKESDFLRLIAPYLEKTHRPLVGGQIH